jgi:hypothetical protein
LKDACRGSFGMDDDRRRSARVSWGELIVETADRAWTAAGNLSTTGVGFGSPVPLTVGEKVTIHFALDGRKVVTSQVKVRWSTGWKSGDAQLHLAGGELRDLSESVRAELDVHLMLRRNARFTEWLLKEYPPHPVKIPETLIGRFPITNQQYLTYLDARGLENIPYSMQVGSSADHPVWGLSRSDALGFVDWLNTGGVRQFRLPSEAEWEYAAKGPSGREYPFGDEFDPAKCNTAEAGIGTTTPVDAYEKYASELGICDLAGNAEEWTSDDYTPYTGGSLIADHLLEHYGPRWPVIRGGSYVLGGDCARSARRHGPHPDPKYRVIGFRVCAAL